MNWPHPVPGFDANHHYYDRHGNPIGLLEWAHLLETEYRLAAEDETNGAVLRTVYLGFVHPQLSDARLFGSGLIVDTTIQQIQVYNSEAEALTEHQNHLDARAHGFHCHLCRIGEEHDD